MIRPYMLWGILNQSRVFCPRTFGLTSWCVSLYHFLPASIRSIPLGLKSYNCAGFDNASLNCSSWISNSGLRGRRRTYLTILKRAWSANFKMVWYILLRPLRPVLDGRLSFSLAGAIQGSIIKTSTIEGLYILLCSCCCCSCSCCWEAFNQTWQYFGWQLIKYDQT
jgi:hypothetical protein